MRQVKKGPKIQNGYIYEQKKKRGRPMNENNGNADAIILLVPDACTQDEAECLVSSLSGGVFHAGLVSCRQKDSLEGTASGGEGALQRGWNWRGGKRGMGAGEEGQSGWDGLSC
jgi:hypothetical protein